MPKSGPGAAVSDIPSLDRLLNAQALAPALAEHGRSQVVAALRKDLAALRERALAGGLPKAELDEAAVAARVAGELRARSTDATASSGSRTRRWRRCCAP
jgi:L-seryl-tRNA(Ser) seleniumtransferase